MKEVFEEPLSADGYAPLLIESTVPGKSIASLAATSLGEIHEKLLLHGALLFRGFAVPDIRAFDGLISILSPNRLNYLYGSTPRQSLGDRIYTATEYPSTLEILLHNENAYQQEWPLKIVFCCLNPATSGGETPLADMRLVSELIGDELLDVFEHRRIKYVRHYRPFVDIPWQKVFQTEDKATLGKFCEENQIEYEWLDSETLRTVQICQGTANHPTLGQRIFFNQSHLFHISSLGEAAESMIKTFGADFLPRQAYFADGEEIPLEYLNRVRSAFKQAYFTFKWEAEDVLLLDNMLYAHGRRPFKGPRSVIAALIEPCSG